MADENLPSFDFIVLHCVYSWVSEDTRAQVRDFVRGSLKPVELVMLSYNAMPGRAHIQPIRRMRRAHAQSRAGSSPTGLHHTAAQSDGGWTCLEWRQY